MHDANGTNTAAQAREQRMLRAAMATISRRLLEQTDGHDPAADLEVETGLVGPGYAGAGERAVAGVEHAAAELAEAMEGMSWPGAEAERIMADFERVLGDAREFLTEWKPEEGSES